MNFGNGIMAIRRGTWGLSDPFKRPTTTANPGVVGLLVATSTRPYHINGTKVGGMGTWSYAAQQLFLAIGEVGQAIIQYNNKIVAAKACHYVGCRMHAINTLSCVLHDGTNICFDCNFLLSHSIFTFYCYGSSPPRTARAAKAHAMCPIIGPYYYYLSDPETTTFEIPI